MVLTFGQRLCDGFLHMRVSLYINIFIVVYGINFGSKANNFLALCVNPKVLEHYEEHLKNTKHISLNLCV